MANLLQFQKMLPILCSNNELQIVDFFSIREIKIFQIYFTIHTKYIEKYQLV